MSRQVDPRRLRRHYDKLGLGQDRSSRYADVAQDALVRRGSFERAGEVFEFGCGTGLFARRLLEKELRPNTRYWACDDSSSMAQITARRLSRFGSRVCVFRSDGRPSLSLAPESCSRIVSCYVLDLLPEAQIREFLRDSFRILARDGLLCLVGMTEGCTSTSRLRMAAWKVAHRLVPLRMGGCRPLDLRSFLDTSDWRLVHHEVIAAKGMPSQVLIVKKDQVSALDLPGKE